jgi:hypothetical protein
MTRTLELPPELESGLEAKAARLGVPVEYYIIGVLRHDIESNGTTAQAARQATAPAHLSALEVLQAPPDVREAALKANAQASAEYYASPKGQAEWDDLADWRALDGEDFHGFEDEDEQEERKAA